MRAGRNNTKARPAPTIRTVHVEGFLTLDTTSEIAPRRAPVRINRPDMGVRDPSSSPDVDDGSDPSSPNTEAAIPTAIRSRANTPSVIAVPRSPSDFFTEELYRKYLCGGWPFT